MTAHHAPHELRSPITTFSFKIEGHGWHLSPRFLRFWWLFSVSLFIPLSHSTVWRLADNWDIIISNIFFSSRLPFLVLIQYQKRELSRFDDGIDLALWFGLSLLGCFYRLITGLFIKELVIGIPFTLKYFVLLNEYYSDLPFAMLCSHRVLYTRIEHMRVAIYTGLVT